MGTQKDIREILKAAARNKDIEICNIEVFKEALVHTLEEMKTKGTK